VSTPMDVARRTEFGRFGAVRGRRSQKKRTTRGASRSDARASRGVQQRPESLTRRLPETSPALCSEVQVRQADSTWAMQEGGVRQGRAAAAAECGAAVGGDSRLARRGGRGECHPRRVGAAGRAPAKQRRQRRIQAQILRVCGGWNFSPAPAIWQYV
jgi:hypothetical protein